MGSEREVLIVVDRERVAIVIIIKLAIFDAFALHCPVDREREAIVIMIKLATFDTDALYRRLK